MIDRVIDISNQRAYVRARNEQLVIEQPDRGEVVTPLAEVAVLILANPQVTCTLAALAGLAQNSGAVVVCDSACMPIGLMLPIVAHYTQTERIAAQVSMSQPMRKRLWQQLVRAKLRAQGRALAEACGDDYGIRNMVDRVRSGDPENVEAQAAARYWPAIFADPTFRRRQNAPDQNRLLNYGYAVLRAVVARAICAVGLHPSLGLHHHNRYDAYCLADDVMEPYRPLVDRAVLDCVRLYGSDVPLDKTTKQLLLGAILNRYTAEGEFRTLFDIVRRVASSLAGALLKKDKTLWLPELVSSAGNETATI